MAPKTEFTPQRIWDLVKEEGSLMLTTLRDKGARRFIRAFVLAGLCVAGAYLGVYKPPQKKILRLTQEIQEARKLSEAGKRYVALRDQLLSAYAALPETKDRDQWLSNALISSLSAGDLTPDSIRPAGEEEASGLIFQSTTVELQIKFLALYEWLLRVEATRPLMHIASLEVQKKAEPLGWNSATCKIMTVIPKKRYN